MMNKLLLFAVLVAYLPLASFDLLAQATQPAKEYADEAAVVWSEMSRWTATPQMVRE